VNRQTEDQETPLDHASGSGELEISRLLVLQGASVHCRDENGGTPLKTASHFGHLDVVRFLIDSGADLNSQDNQGWTPLHAAQSEGHLDVEELLLARGADFSIRDDLFDLPEIIAESGNPGVGDFPFEQVADSMSLLVDGAANTTPSTISLQDVPHILHLPPQKPEEDAREDVTSDSEHQQCLVYSASQNGQLYIVRSLLDRGYDVNDRNTRRETALDVASRFGELEVARLLIERGADVDARDRDGWTPLITALEYGQLDVARLLLDHSADVNVKTRYRNTALHHASFYGHIEIVRALLELGADVNVRNQDGQTPRQMAIQLGHHRAVELLSDFGDHSQDITIQGALTLRSERMSPPEISVQTPAPRSGPPAPVIRAPAPATQFAANSTDTVATSVSLHGGRVPAPLPGRTSRLFPALPEASDPPPCPVPVSGGDSHQRSAEGKTDRDIQRLKSLGDELQTMINATTVERNKAAQTAQWMGRAPNTTIVTQVLIGALATALDALLSGDNALAISILGSASIFVVSYLVLARGSKEHRELLLRVKALNHFLHEIEVFQLEHGHETACEWYEKDNGFRLGLENILGNQPGSITINSEAAGTHSGPEGEVRAMNPGLAFNEIG
ncbi:Ankyrin repeat-containing domain protein, partial [Lactarius tabidus]